MRNKTGSRVDSESIATDIKSLEGDILDSLEETVGDFDFLFDMEPEMKPPPHVESVDFQELVSDLSLQVLHQKCETRASSKARSNSRFDFLRLNLERSRDRSGSKHGKTNSRLFRSRKRKGETRRSAPESLTSGLGSRLLRTMGEESVEGNEHAPVNVRPVTSKKKQEMRRSAPEGFSSNMGLRLTGTLSRRKKSTDEVSVVFTDTEWSQSASDFNVRRYRPSPMPPKKRESQTSAFSLSSTLGRRYRRRGTRNATTNPRFSKASITSRGKSDL